MLPRDWTLEDGSNLDLDPMFAAWPEGGSPHDMQSSEG
jgi:hypothetical protein